MEKNDLCPVFPCAFFTLQNYYIFYKIDSEKKRYSPAKNLFRLFKTIEKDFLISESLFSFTIHIIH